uniref:PIN domain-containing protein n=1 Tax=Candidatus Kentrum eta TaxID=2126337 RepID=A0A450UB70_9GAMM|nr:MAG: hypothetical protein BECKH772A_GA0070896_100153 [Candidatus Kentron sp. H]VFJ90979.1 MAG: hypothetical protein BECKH772B_GA0070898_100133 [Candidatus Kentron sp. H]VFJ97302.1 MAG: hypothetical protein BECKH772C_GA0070978_100123 [Candidatus Kentron sp. H]
MGHTRKIELAYVINVIETEAERARSLRMTDFEDAVVAGAAESAGCKWVVTRNPKDFSASPVSALTPEEFLAHCSNERDHAR